jgi:hypothetical protein
MVAAIGGGAAFAKGRDYSAWLGLVPKQMSTGDRTILGHISKRGNGYLRMLWLARSTATWTFFTLKRQSSKMTPYGRISPAWLRLCVTNSRRKCRFARLSPRRFSGVSFLMVAAEVRMLLARSMPLPTSATKPIDSTRSAERERLGVWNKPGAPVWRAGTKPALTRFFSKGRNLVKEKTVQDHKGKKHAADTARAGGAAYAPHDKGAEKLAQKARDDRAANRAMGQIKRAKKKN